MHSNNPTQIVKITKLFMLEWYLGYLAAFFKNTPRPTSLHAQATRQFFKSFIKVKKSLGYI